MNAITLVLTDAARWVVGLAVSLVPVCCPLQEPAAPPPTQAQMDRMKEIYLPGAHHAWLERFVGSWNQEVAYASGTGDPLRATGRLTNRAILGGRFVVSEGSARPAKGTDTEALFVWGFDGRTRQYTVIVLDTFGTYYVTAAGPAPAAGEPLVLRGETPERGGTKKFDVVLRWIDAHTYRTEIVFHFPGRPPVAVVTATCRRDISSR